MADEYVTELKAKVAAKEEERRLKAAELLAEQRKVHAAKRESLDMPDYGDKGGPGLLTKGHALDAKGVPNVVKGGVSDSAGYSVLKAAFRAAGMITDEQAKEEVEASRRLKALYGHEGKFGLHGPSILVLGKSDYLPCTYPDGSSNGEAVKFREELRQKSAQVYGGRPDPDEAGWLAKKLNARTKAAWSPSEGTLSDALGGVLVGFPTLGELIDLQRNMEVMPQAGCTETALPANGMIAFPKLTGGSTAYWVGEAQTITNSTQSTGSLTLQGKKLAVMTPINNELIRYAGATAEAMVRRDMSLQGALAVDLANLEGTGGTQIQGLLKYPTTTSWSQGVDKLLVYTATTVGVNGDTFQPQDMMKADAQLPDAVNGGTAWLVNKVWFGNVVTRRSDAVTAGDAAGQFTFDAWRSLADKHPSEMGGVKVVRSRQIKFNRSKGSASNLTYVLYGMWSDWIIARHGVVEFLANPYDGQSFTNDQMLIRAIQHVDAGARHAASFVLIDTLLNA